MKETALSKRIVSITEELISAFVDAGGELTDREIDELYALRGVCKNIIKANEGLDTFNKMVELAEFNMKKKERENSGQ